MLECGGLSSLPRGGIPATAGVVTILAVLLFANACGATVFSNSLQLCVDECTNRNLAIPLPLNSLSWHIADFNDCDFSCQIEACQLGCKDLEQAAASCDERCGVSKSPASCHQGCFAVSSIFLHQIQYLLNHVAVESKFDSLRGIVLSWSFAETFSTVMQEMSVADLRWFAQSRRHSTHLRVGGGWKWTEFPPGAFRESFAEVMVTVPIEDTSEVHIRLAVVWRDKVVVSRTFFHTVTGVPVKPRKPVLLTLLQPKAHPTLVCWQGDPTDHLVRGSLTYSVQVKKSDDEEVLRDFTTQAQCHDFIDMAHTGQTVNVVVRERGEDEAAVSEALVVPDVHLKTYSPPKADNRLLFITNGSAVIKMADPNDYLLLGDIEIVDFDLKDHGEITALASSGASKVLVGFGDGAILELDLDLPPTIDEEAILDAALENSTDSIVRMIPSKQTIIREPDGTAVTQLVVDGIQQFVYALRNQSGIIRCGLTDGCANATMLTTNSVNYINAIAVDTWNGFLYYSTSNGDVFIATLFPVEAPSVYSFSIQRRLAGLQSVASLQVDYQLHDLVAVLRNGSLVAMNIADHAVRFLHTKRAEKENYANVHKSIFMNDRLFFISTDCGDDHGWKTCFYSEETADTGEIHLNRYLFEGPVTDVVILHNTFDPPYLLPPEKIGLVITNANVKVTWLPAESLPFQATGSTWRNVHYVVNITDAVTGHDLHTHETSETDILVPLAVEPLVKVTVAIRSCVTSGGTTICSKAKKASSESIGAIDATSGSSKLLVYVNAGKTEDHSLEKNNILGLPVDDPFYPRLATEGADVVAFDNATESLFSTVVSDISIFKTPSGGYKNRFLDFITVSYMDVISNKACIFFSSMYQILQYRLTGTFERVIYNCGETDCPEVVGMAADHAGGRIFYFLQAPNGSVSLNSFTVDSAELVVVAVVDLLPVMKQVVFMEGHFVFITLDGRVGSFNTNLANLQYNYCVTNAKHLMVNVPIARKAIQFTSELQVDAESPSTLHWNVVPPADVGGVLYKVQLFKDRSNGDSSVGLSVANTYAIPQSVLDAWPSQQQYDAIIDAITPWSVVSLNASGLVAPTKPPSPPKNVNIYVTQQKTVDGARAIVDLFWDEPEEWNGDMLGYVVNCSVTDGSSKSSMVVQNISGKDSLTYSFSVKSGKVACAVAASNQQNLLGDNSETVTVDSSDVRPLVRLFAIDSSSNLVAISNWSSIWEGARSKRQTTTVQASYQGVAFVDNNLYAIRKEDSVQPFAVMLDINNVENALHKVQLNTELTDINALTSDWVANRLLYVAGHDLYQIFLDTFESVSVTTPLKVISLSAGAQDAKQLVFDPFSNSAYLLTKNGSLFRLDLTHKTEQNLALALDCLASQTVTSMTTEFKWNRAASPTIYALTWNGLIALDLASGKCSDIDIAWEKFGDKGLKSVISIAIADELFVFGTATELIIYDRQAATNRSVPIQNSPLRQILAVSQSSQPYPERTCFQLPSPETIEYNVTNQGRTGAYIQIDEITPTTCLALSFPPIQYDIYFRRQNTDKIKHFRSISDKVPIENGILDKETDYDVYLSWFNRYYTYKDLYSDIHTFKTGYGYPTAPRDVTAFALSPDTILLSWRPPLSLNAPKDEIRYRITQQSSAISSPTTIGARQYANNTFSGNVTDVVACFDVPCLAKIGNLRAATDYKFWVTAVHISRLQVTFDDDPEAVSLEADTRSLDMPGTLRLDNATSDSLILRWTSLEPNSQPKTISIQYRLTGAEDIWNETSNSVIDPSSEQTLTIVVSDLRSSTAYDYRFVATYNGKYPYNDEERPYVEMFNQTTQQGRTKPGTPSAPTRVRLMKERNYLILRWSEPDNDGGAPIVSYAVEYRPNPTAEWEIAERGLPPDRLWWRPDRANIHALHAEFRVRAANSEGFGVYGFLDDGEESSDETSMGFYVLIALIVLVVAIAITVCLILAYRFYKKKTEKRRLYDTNLKLKPLAHASRDVNRIRDANAENLPHVSPECVSKGNLLGKGSFGEVYEGVAWNMPTVGKKRMPVAIKTLRRNHTPEENSKFIQEAILMNKFDHEHIVKLLGVCFEGEPHMLIIELMEGGDLLNFLRASRPQDSVPSQLSLQEIFWIIIDVARGCYHLETNKYVHRDIAARNCLISSRAHPTRITKIADFGMAKQMYATNTASDNNYYRLHSADLVPIRWLSPEAGLDCVYTTKSDVWAYGVLCWETLALGDQPYKHRSNEMIMPYVREGGRLEKPPECPEELYDIMYSCWDINPDVRPSFGVILERLEELQNRPENQSNLPFPSQHGYINNGFDASHDSSISQLGGDQPRSSNSNNLLSGSGRFDKHDGAHKSSGLSHFRNSTFTQRRPESVFSNQTEMTAFDDEAGEDYEIPISQGGGRSTTASPATTPRINTASHNSRV